MAAVIKDDHPVRTTFIESVAQRCGMSMEQARKFIAPISTDLIDRDWPLEQVVLQHKGGDRVAVYYPK